MRNFELIRNSKLFKGGEFYFFFIQLEYLRSRKGKFFDTYNTYKSFRKTYVQHENNISIFSSTWKQFGVIKEHWRNKQLKIQ